MVWRQRARNDLLGLQANPLAQAFPGTIKQTYSGVIELQFRQQRKVVLAGSDRGPIAARWKLSFGAPQRDSTPVTVAVMVRRKQPIDSATLGTAEG